MSAASASSRAATPGYARPSSAILLLTGADDAGQPILQPFQHEATAAVKADPVRRARRKPDETA